MATSCNGLIARDSYRHDKCLETATRRLFITISNAQHTRYWQSSLDLCETCYKRYDMYSHQELTVSIRHVITLNEETTI